jgi:mRNA-degrading endonuclease RelE of RelBE toxin-antitoxin system
MQPHSLIKTKQQAPMRIEYIPPFRKDVKRLSKKYASLLNDLRDILTELDKNPQLGQPIGRDCYKIRVNITSKKRGKSGGGRLITCVRLMDDVIYMLTIYDKSEKENIDEEEFDLLLSYTKD